MFSNLIFKMINFYQIRMLEIYPNSFFLSLIFRYVSNKVFCTGPEQKELSQSHLLPIKKLYPKQKNLENYRENK